jgi:hypothetical protein
MNTVTHKTDWTLPEIKFVHNTPSDPVERVKKHLLWDAFIPEPEKNILPEQPG